MTIDISTHNGPSFESESRWENFQNNFGKAKNYLYKLVNEDSWDMVTEVAYDIIGAVGSFSDAITDLNNIKPSSKKVKGKLKSRPKFKVNHPKALFFNKIEQVISQPFELLSLLFVVQVPFTIRDLFENIQFLIKDREQPAQEHRLAFLDLIDGIGDMLWYLSFTGEFLGPFQWVDPVGIAAGLFNIASLISTKIILKENQQIRYQLASALAKNNNASEQERLQSLEVVLQQLQSLQSHYGNRMSERHFSLTGSALTEQLSLIDSSINTIIQNPDMDSNSKEEAKQIAERTVQQLDKKLKASRTYRKIATISSIAAVSATAVGIVSLCCTPLGIPALITVLAASAAILWGVNFTAGGVGYFHNYLSSRKFTQELNSNLQQLQKLQLSMVSS